MAQEEMKDLRDLIKPSSDIEIQEIAELWKTLVRDRLKSPEDEERSDLDRISNVGNIQLTLDDGEGEPVPLPDAVKRALLTALRALAHGDGVAVVPADNELTTGEAADLLGMSRTYLVQLLDRGKIPYIRETERSHRRLRAEVVLAYKRKRQSERVAALRRHDEKSEKFNLP
jgi:excisionase family DNA binding protein